MRLLKRNATKLSSHAETRASDLGSRAETRASTQRELARSLLGHAVGDALSSPVAALEAGLGVLLARRPARLSPRRFWSAALRPQNATGAHAERLRDVIDRDRALSAVRSIERAPLTLAAPPPTPAPAEMQRDSPEREPDEPIRTRTMARLLAAQGHRQRALAIYDFLIAEGDAEPSLCAEAEQLRAQAS